MFKLLQTIRPKSVLKQKFHITSFARSVFHNRRTLLQICTEHASESKFHKIRRLIFRSKIDFCRISDIYGPMEMDKVQWKSNTNIMVEEVYATMERNKPYSTEAIT